MTIDLSSLPSTQCLARSHNIIAHKKFGQNFIFDSNITDKIVKCSNNVQNIHVLEIGPGPGGLTRSLLAAGAIVTVIEIDKHCIDMLKNTIAPIAKDRLHIIEGDALNKDIYKHIPQGSRIIANLPYNISTSLLTMWLDMPDKFSEYILMFQKEVAQRIDAKPNSKKYSRLSVKVQLLCDTEHQFDVPPSAFHPAPKVTSSIMKIVPYQKPKFNFDKIIMDKLCKALFNQRRKTLRVSMKQISLKPLELLKLANIDGNRRPEQLSLEEFCRLAKVVKQHNN